MSRTCEFMNLVSMKKDILIKIKIFSFVDQDKELVNLWNNNTAEEESGEEVTWKLPQERKVKV